MTSTWDRLPIAQLGRTVTGRTPSTAHPEFFGDEFPFITPTDMDGRRTIRTTLRGVSNQGAAELKGKLLPPGSVAVSCIGWQLGKAVIVGTEAYCNQQLNVVIPNTNVDATYLYYHLITRREEIRNLGSVGTRTPILKKSAFERLEIPLPPIHVQRKIAAILSSYDDLIENNTRRIELLDEMAQRIYSEWFVDYRFPGHDVVALVDSELGQIPDGWKVGVIGDVLEVLEAGSRPKGGIDPSERGVPSVGAENVLGLGRYEFEREKFISSLFFEQMRRGRVVSGDVVLYKDGAYIGRVSLFRDGFPHDECAVNEHVFILRTNRQLSQSFMYFWLAEPGNQDRVKSLNANSAQPGINQEKLKSLAIVLPPSELVQRFTERIEPMLALLFNLARSLRVLKGARDLLLPRLISGDLDVSDLEIAFLETAT